MMKKRLIIFSSILFILCAGCLAATDDIKTESLVVNAEVPEDYGIVFPPEALHMDRIYFTLQPDAENVSDYLMSEETLIDLGNMDIGLNEFRISLVYYGNQINPYAFTIDADAGIGWYDEKGNNMTIEIKMEDPDTEDDIYVTEISNAAVSVTVPPAGPRRGDPVADVALSWELGLDLEPGVYSALLTLRMNTL